VVDNGYGSGEEFMVSRRGRLKIVVNHSLRVGMMQPTHPLHLLKKNKEGEGERNL